MAGKVVGLGFEITSKLDSYFLITVSILNFGNLLDFCEHQDSISHANGCDGRLHAALEPLLCNVTRSFTERIFALKLLHQKDCSVI